MSSATTGGSFLSLEDARVYQGDLWCHKIRLKYLGWSVLSKLFAINLVFPEWQHIPSGQFNCQLENHIPVTPLPERDFFISAWRSHSRLRHNATPQNRLCLRDSVSQCDWCSPWDPAVDETLFRTRFRLYKAGVIRVSARGREVLVLE